MKRLLFALLSLPLLSACYYDNEEDLYPAAAVCDTTATTYTQRISPIIQAKCLACHSTGNATGIVLDNHAQLQPIAHSGLLLKVISHDPGVPAMPRDAPKLSDCEIAIIRKWVDNGSQNN